MQKSNNYSIKLFLTVFILNNLEVLVEFNKENSYFAIDIFIKNVLF